jgi:hypothetical protein
MIMVRPGGSFSSCPRVAAVKGSHVHVQISLLSVTYSSWFPSHHSTTITPNHELFTRTGASDDSDHSDVLPVDR